jgi:predicted  nucleic acid-binding Zn-ribbon protein
VLLFFFSPLSRQGLSRLQQADCIHLSDGLFSVHRLRAADTEGKRLTSDLGDAQSHMAAAEDRARALEEGLWKETQRVAAFEAQVTALKEHIALLEKQQSTAEGLWEEKEQAMAEALRKEREKVAALEQQVADLKTRVTSLENEQAAAIKKEHAAGVEKQADVVARDLGLAREGAEVSTLLLV